MDTLQLIEWMDLGGRTAEGMVNQQARRRLGSGLGILGISSLPAGFNWQVRHQQGEDFDAGIG